MTTYTPIVAGDIDADSPITTGLMTLMRDNPIAIMEKASGAPVLANGYIVEAMMGANCVDQQSLKDATSAQSMSITNNDLTEQLALTGATFSMVTAKSNTGTETGGVFVGEYGGNATAGYVGWGNTTSGYTFTGYVDSRYFQASPPYGTADGPIPLFCYVQIEKITGKYLGISVAPDPIWAYHGPTDIRGKKKLVPLIATEMDLFESLKQAMLTNNIAEVGRIRDRMATDEKVEIEITLDYKNSDMDIAPHPWMKNNLGPRLQSTGARGGVVPATTGSEVILLDPQETLALHDLHMLDPTGKEVFNMIESGAIKIDNTPLNRVVPAGVKAYAFRF